MTKKDFEELAKIVALAKIRLRGSVTSPQTVIEYFETELADFATRDNPRFDRSRFKEACK